MSETSMPKSTATGTSSEPTSKDGRVQQHDFHITKKLDVASADISVSDPPPKKS